ncbi:hypothetical protein WJX72_000629 [[Myrmecia] bisecta]|uniref:Adenylate cyclase n=1 Tax=[Myrmecia] bisecta TaxID=41462 RepID=A0AAW1P5U3_9CHLO
MRDNSLTGTLPDEMLQLQLLTDLWLSQNQLAGALNDVASLPNIRRVLLARNGFTGAIPATLPTSTVEVLDLGSNFLTGTLPAGWHQAQNLRRINLAGNAIRGTIPVPSLSEALSNTEAGSSNMDAILNEMLPAITAVRSMQQGTLDLLLDSNQLTGTIGPGLAMLPLSNLRVSGNKLSGSLPSTFLSMPFIRTLDVHMNELTGTLPAAVHALELEILDLAGNAISGSIPAQLAECKALGVIDVSFNQLTGALPQSFVQLQDLSTLTTIGNRLSNGAQKSASGYNLPDWLTFDMSGGRAGGFIFYQEQLICYDVVANFTLLPMLYGVNVDPSYFDFQNCACTTGYDFNRGTNGRISCDLHVMGVMEGFNGWKNVGIPVEIVTLLAMVATFLLMRWRMPGKRVLSQSKARAAEQEQTTLVLSDIEGLAELTNWNATAMRSALLIHDRMIRSLLSKYRGHEESAENGTFAIVFAEATDAVAWCLATQQALLDARWPHQLQHHEHTRPLMASQLAEAEAADQSTDLIPAALDLSHMSMQPGKFQTADQASGDESDLDDIGFTRKKRLQWDAELEHTAEDTIKAEKKEVDTLLFSGLRVRMCVVTGRKDKPDKANRVALAKPTDQYNTLLKAALAIADVSHGGQVMVDAPTFSCINHCLTDIAVIVPQGPRGRGNDDGSRKRRVSLSTQMPDPRLIAAEPAARSNSWSPAPRTKSVESARSKSSFGLGDRVVSRVLSALLRHTSHTSQGSAGNHAEQPSSEGNREGITVVDMGLHQLARSTEPQQLHQILVPGILDRARHLPPLMSVKQLSPGYFDAPLARESPLSASSTYQPTKPVTMVFTLMDKLAQMKLENPGAAAIALALYRDCLRKTLAGRGVECQELDGSFMLVFHNVTDAIQFCILAQEALLAVAWGSAVLSLSACRPAISETTHQVVFQGPRARMGIYEGIPTKVTPHSTTGRADYFGPLVNRCARICNASAQGGQILTNWEAVRRAVKHWAPEATLEPPEEGQAPVTISAVYLKRNAQAMARLSGRTSLEASSLLSALEAWQRASQEGGKQGNQDRNLTDDDEVRVVAPTTFLLPDGWMPLSPKESLSIDGANGSPRTTIMSVDHGRLMGASSASPVESPSSPKEAKPLAAQNPVVSGAEQGSAAAVSPRDGKPLGLEAVAQRSALPGEEGAPASGSIVAASMRGPSSSFNFAADKGNASMRGPSSSFNFAADKGNAAAAAAAAAAPRNTRSSFSFQPPVNHLESSLYTHSQPIAQSELLAGIMTISNTEDAQNRASVEIGKSNRSSNEGPQADDEAPLRRKYSRRASLDSKRRSMAQMAGISHQGSGSSTHAHSLDRSQDAWRGITHLHIHHAGRFKVKGVKEEFTLMQINSDRLAGRAFPTMVTGKAQLMKPPQGLKYTLVFEDNVEHMRVMMGDDDDSDDGINI